jgi:hypothetical protein
MLEKNGKRGDYAGVGASYARGNSVRVRADDRRQDA